MTVRLDRSGIFKAKPFDWKVFNAESGAVAVSIGFEVVAQLDGTDWIDWGEYETHHCYGNWWVVKKDGQINQGPVEQLALCLGWDGNLATVARTDPPEMVVQITVKEDEYNGKVRYQATWLNPEDYVPSSQGASEDEVRQLDARFGSLLRAAAASSAGTSKPAPPASELPPVTDSDIPFAWLLPLVLLGLIA